MSTELTKIETIKLDGRVVDLIASVEFRKGNAYYNRVTGQQVNLLQIIQPLFPNIRRSAIQIALRQLCVVPSSLVRWVDRPRSLRALQSLQADLSPV